MIVSRTPLRISLVGGGSDLPSYYERRPGAVVALAITKYVYVAVHRRFDDAIRVVHSALECAERLDDVRHDLVRECLRLTGVTRGIEVATFADVPAGTGLGSSSSVTVGLLHALYALRGVRRTPAELAADACRVEIDILGHPIGKQDQFMAACGGVRHLTFRPNGQVGTRRLAIAPDAARRLVSGLALFHVGGQRDANQILAGVRERIATDGDHRAVLDRTIPVVHDLARRIAGGEFAMIGHALNHSWTAKRSLSAAVSTERLDRLHALACAAGASGAKILGAGGAGFMLVAVDRAHRSAVEAALAHEGARVTPFDIDHDGTCLLHPSGRPTRRTRVRTAPLSRRPARR